MNSAIALFKNTSIHLIYTQISAKADGEKTVIWNLNVV